MNCLYCNDTWWFIIARRQSIHKCTSSSASPKLILECDEEKCGYIDRRFFSRIDWCGFSVPPWRSRASEALCFSDERRPFASANDELLALWSLCMKLHINIDDVRLCNRCRTINQSARPSSLAQCQALSIDSQSLPRAVKSGPTCSKWHFINPGQLVQDVSCTQSTHKKNTWPWPLTLIFTRVLKVVKVVLNQNFTKLSAAVRGQWISQPINVFFGVKTHIKPKDIQRETRLRYMPRLKKPVHHL